MTAVDLASDEGPDSLIELKQRGDINPMKGLAVR